MNDRIRIEGLEIFANHGVLAEENVLGQKFVIDCDMEVDTRLAARTDDIEHSVNYASVAHLITEVMQGETNRLIETCAEHVANAVLAAEPLVKAVRITVSKPWAPVGLPLKTVSVSCERRWSRAFIAMGSNMGDSRALIEDAMRKLGENSRIRVAKVSSLIETEPYGVTDQPAFLNGAALIFTTLTPHELLDELHRIENEAGRERVLRWGPRTLDLDILMYEDLILEDDDLCIPHPDMLNRRFVLDPMREIAPYAIHPITKGRMVDY